MAIIIKSVAEIAAMRRAGGVVASILRILSSEIKAGMTTRQLDEIAVKELERYGAKPSFKGYRGFPAALCVSINDEVVHGIPGDRVTQKGDLVSLDFGAIVDGFHGDAAVTVGIGKISGRAKRLMETTRDCLEAAIAVAHPGTHLSDISAAIQYCAESRNFSVVREYTGHGIGREMHEEPQIPNFGPPGLGPILQKGMTLAIEPMVNIGGWRTKVMNDGWTVVTANGNLSAHFEKTIAITDGEAEVLTPWD
ncbi:MAG: type I methionyl aminopeptidase [Dehalococcoidales bacterium]|nr:type I methionyl aminopeptidase [Dehalococcoidales bacterium]